ncbi:MAG: DUF3427 domain-containing protein [Solobacterium sp.]|jgi:superfamily II DNA or RNA helicase|nr:DUF3427 domain-containing protein [Solobacterium sp.]MCH4222474.1 DUF3427 domain-containing protein [Solobacterium sp.]MCH4266090.1 DUF3427 domain-containing protein [Solobacterium sp.]
MLKTGIYEQIVNQKIQKELSDVPEEQKYLEKIDQAEASRILSQYVAEVIRRGMDQLGEGHESLEKQVELSNRIIDLIGDYTEGQNTEDQLSAEEAQQLLAVLNDQAQIAAGKKAKDLARPETSVSSSSLFTGAPDEPQMYSELKKEILSSDRIEMLVSFVKWSGLRLIINELKEFTARGGTLKVITTSYMGATDLKAVEELRLLCNTEVKVSYDTRRTRLHAKTYFFRRDTGFDTAYVGSSNLSNAAISSGLEWNLKITSKDQPDTIQKISATFESYWNSDEFELYTEADKEKLAQALQVERYNGDADHLRAVFDIRPYPYQQEILDALDAERKIRNRYRNLVVAATGTGKTVIAALDYQRFCNEHANQPNRLLFVAHREEILLQSQATFQGVLKDLNFGQIWDSHYQIDSTDHLFASIQTLNARELTQRLPEDYYDFIIVDEFHHAAADSYQDLLNHFKPKILLGLTATPERLDGKSILDYFDGHVAAEIRLPEAVDRKLLCPFQYFGISDSADLSQLKWSRGGYEKSQLSELYTENRGVALQRAGRIIQSLDQYVTDINTVKGLGFCVTKEHARFMQEQFNAAGIPSIALTAESSKEERDQARNLLVSGQVKFIFVVDLYNEGVDIPEVNTILFLRPTESLTIFLQQLGRGLRLAEQKDCLTVLDYIGQANKKYNFAEKYSALMCNSTHSVSYEIRHGFDEMPKGCFIQLEKKASEYILKNIQQSFDTRKGMISRIESFTEDTGLSLNLANFLDYYHLEVKDIYDRKTSFARLCVDAGVREDFHEPQEERLTKAFGSFGFIDSRRWIAFLLDILSSPSPQNISHMNALQKRMLEMFYITVFGSYAEDWNSETVLNQLNELYSCKVMCAELCELLQYCYDHIDFIDQPSDLGDDCPLDVHCTYSRDQLFTAMDYTKAGNIREGVKWLPEQNADVLLVTLNKSDKDYSPSTMYEDYSINDHLFHWQSQSTTSETSPVGRRYINHVKQGSNVLLFVRERKNKDGLTQPYTFLGTAEYVSHTGSHPMSIVWRLKNAIPARFMRKTNRLIG